MVKGVLTTCGAVQKRTLFETKLLSGRVTVLVCGRKCDFVRVKPTKGARVTIPGHDSARAPACSVLLEPVDDVITGLGVKAEPDIGLILRRLAGVCPECSTS